MIVEINKDKINIRLFICPKCNNELWLTSDAIGKPSHLCENPDIYLICDNCKTEYNFEINITPKINMVKIDNHFFTKHGEINGN